MLPAGKHVHSVYFGDDGVAVHADKGTLFLDCSTISVEESRSAAEKATAAGFLMADAPVSGGTAAAEAGTLTFMVGGTDEAYTKARPFLDVMGKNVFHAGASGNGQVAKIANNMLLGISMIGTCEAFNLAEKLGLDAQTFYDISSTASGQCWSMTSYCPAPGPVPTRLQAGLCRGHDAERPQARTRSRARRRRRYAARSARRRDLRKAGRGRPYRARLLRCHETHPRRAIVTRKR